MEGPPVRQHEVQILTLSFQISGKLEVIGTFLQFLNDPVRDALLIYEATVVPLVPGGPLRPLARSQISLRKPEVVFLYLTEPAGRAEVRQLIRKETLIAYTPLAILRGAFNMSAESRPTDFLATMSADFVLVSEASLFMLTDALTSIPKECPLLLVGRQYIQLYHPL